MDAFPTGTRTLLGRCVSAEIRALMGTRRLALRVVASEAGLSSHNYLAIRLNDEKPFTLDDIERLVEFFYPGPDGMDAPNFIARAERNHVHEVGMQSLEASPLTPAERRVAALMRAVGRDGVIVGSDGGQEMYGVTSAGVRIELSKMSPAADRPDVAIAALDDEDIAGEQGSANET